MIADSGRQVRTRDAFLACVHIGVLTVAGPTGHRWRRCGTDTSRGGNVEFTTEGSSTKTQLLTAARQASLCVQREEMPYAFVTVEGSVTITQATRGIRTEIAARYLGEKRRSAYVEFTPAGDDVLVQLVPERWRTSDFAKLDLGSPPER